MDRTDSQSLRAGIYRMLLVLAVIVLAAALRVYGLRWGLPDSLHSYSYHPDEFLTVTTVYLTMLMGQSREFAS